MSVSAEIFAEGLIRVDGRWVEDPAFDPHRIIRPEDEEQESEAAARARAVAAEDADHETRERAELTAGDLVRVVDEKGARWVEPGRAPGSMSGAMEALHAEMKELDELSQRVILAPKAKKRLAELPGLIAAIHRREEEAAQAKESDDAEFREHYEGAVQEYLTALRAFVDAKDDVDRIRLDAMARGIYLEKIEVRASQDRTLYKLLERARATALA